MISKWLAYCIECNPISKENIDGEVLSEKDDGYILCLKLACEHNLKTGHEVLVGDEFYYNLQLSSEEIMINSLNGDSRVLDLINGDEWLKGGKVDG